MEVEGEGGGVPLGGVASLTAVKVVGVSGCNEMVGVSCGVMVGGACEGVVGVLFIGVMVGVVSDDAGVGWCAVIGETFSPSAKNEAEHQQQYCNQWRIQKL